MKFITDRFYYCIPKKYPYNYTLHRRHNENSLRAWCNHKIELHRSFYSWWTKEHSKFSDICQKCLATYNKETINKIKQIYILRKLKS